MAAATTRVITVGIEGERSGVPIVRWAAAEAVRRGAMLRIVSVWTMPVLGWSDMGAAPNLDPALFQEAAQAVTAAAAETVRADLGDAAPPLDLSTPEGPPAATLLAIAVDSELLVVGAHNHRSLDVLGLGSVATACIHHAKVPVVVVRRSSADAESDSLPGVERGPIVVGIDDSPGARTALALAAELAVEREAPLHVVHAWMTHPWPSDDNTDAGTPEEQAAADALAGRIVGEVLADGGPASVTVTATSGPSAEVLLTASSGADLLVVGTRGRGGFTRMLLGSVSSSVVAHAECPVVVVPAPH